MKQNVGHAMLWYIDCTCINYVVKVYGIYDKRNSCLGRKRIKDDGVLIKALKLHMMKT